MSSRYNFNKIMWIKLHNNERHVKMIEQLKRLAVAITYGIHSEQHLIIVDYVMVDGKDKPISSCVDIDSLNKQIKKWNIKVMDKKLYEYKLLQIFYGTDELNCVDVTQQIIGKTEGYIKIISSFNPNLSCGGDPYPGIAKQILICAECNNMTIYHTIQEHCEKLTNNFEFNFKDLNKKDFIFIPNFNKDPEHDDIYNEVINIF